MQCQNNFISITHQLSEYKVFANCCCEIKEDEEVRRCHKVLYDGFNGSME